jgi:hypothetical protein
VKAVSVNPFLTIMYKSMSFKAWLNIYRKNYEKRQDEINYGVDRDSSDDDIETQKDDDYEYEVLEDVTVEDEDELKDEMDE